MNEPTGGLVLLHEEISREIIGAFFDVYNELRPGFLASVYKRAMFIALNERGIACEREKSVTVHFHGTPVGDFRADLLVEKQIIIELKTVDKIHAAHEARVLNYLKATRVHVGFVLNFGPKPSFRRLVSSTSLRGQATDRH